MDTAIVICTRTDSSRIPSKPFRTINGKPIIVHLIERLQPTGLPIVLAYPREQLEYESLSGMNNVILFPSELSDDPLRRMHEVSKKLRLSNVIRITHDKILVRHQDIDAALTGFKSVGADYMFGSKFTPGSGFEIISAECLERAAIKFSKVEHVSYAVRAVTTNIYTYDPRHPNNSFRFLIDYPEDMALLEVIFSRLGNGCDLHQAIEYMNNNAELSKINKLPLVTVYTCALNAERFLTKCMQSVYMQDLFDRIEYILIDDHSQDGTFEIMHKYALNRPNVKCIRNQKNIGLASSSNIALENARGKYIIRIDADDFFVLNSAVADMVRTIEQTGSDVIYPNNFLGDFDKIQEAEENHHIGGALFNRSAINHIKFTEGLRGHDSLDVFVRSQGQLKIGYLHEPVFFYTQRKGSLSKTNTKARAKLREVILRSACENTTL